MTFRITFLETNLDKFQVKQKLNASFRYYFNINILWILFPVNFNHMIPFQSTWEFQITLQIFPVSHKVNKIDIVIYFIKDAET